MANTTAVYARIDTDLKENAESILSKLGITPASAIQMLYSQIVLRNGMPFELKLPYTAPIAMEGLSREQLDIELQKGVDSLKNGKGLTADEVDAQLRREFGIYWKSIQLSTLRKLWTTFAQFILISHSNSKSRILQRNLSIKYGTTYESSTSSPNATLLSNGSRGKAWV